MTAMAKAAPLAACAQAIGVTSLHAPPYAALTLQFILLPKGSRSRHKAWLHAWLPAHLTQMLGGKIDLSFHPGSPPRLMQNDRRLGLSLAYARDAAMLAVAADFSVGVDLLWLGDIGDDDLRVANDFLPATEYQALRCLPAARRPDCFGLAWTRLEAALKAAGLPLAKSNALTLEQWHQAVPVPGLPPGYCAAVARGLGPV